MRDISEIAARLGIDESELRSYGRHAAKVSLPVCLGRPRRGRLVLVTGTNPTPAGEGKTTLTIGIADALRRLGHDTCAALREPSLGPIMGVKGGATGGGGSALEPTDEINLHFTGDFAAVASAHNLLAALVDNLLHHEGHTAPLSPTRVLLRRVLDHNDRALRQVVIGLGGKQNGVPRESGFDIVPASEVMAILCLSRDREDLKRRLGRILVGFDRDGSPLTAADLGAVGAMAALLNHALLPNLVQSREETPALVHGGPFANIAHGTNSLLATRAGLSLCDLVITEAGFGFDLGGEKFLDIVCPQGDFSPALVVIVVSARSLKLHGGARADALESPDPEAVRAGFPNLDKHLENLRGFGLAGLVALNRFASDSEEEIEVIRDHCQDLRIRMEVSESFLRGSEGSLDLARGVLEEMPDEDPPHTPLYDWSLPVKEKIDIIAGRIYGAGSVEYTTRAEADLATIERLGGEGLPICMAKTQKSLSDNPRLLGRPEGFTLKVQEIRLAAGAGFLIPLTGTILTMPGLPRATAAENIDLTSDGHIRGLR